MIAIHLPSFDDEQAAMDWLHEQGTVCSVYLLRGADGLIRGTALLEDDATRRLDQA